MLGHRLSHSLIFAASLPAWLRLRRALASPRRAQERLLASYLRDNANTELGRRHRFAAITSVEEFRDAVPVRTYDDFEPWIERIRHAEPNVLTAEPVVMMEKTSGSTGPAKLIPYTASLRREFQRAVGAWLVDLYRHRPALFGGPHYWSISPATRQREFTPGGLPVGFADDSEYLGRLTGRVLRGVMAVPGEVSRVSEIDAFRRLTVEHLLRCPGLRLISVWNPSFLTLLLDHLPPDVEPREAWPELALISCWADAAARRFLPELQALFPGVEIQGKGLLSTEGVVSLPLVGAAAPAPAITSHFLEFLDADDRPHLVDELEVGKRYRVVITTGGGLARYATGDEVAVVAPSALEFVGRADRVSDLTGEKLAEPFVAQVLTATAARFELDGFMMLAPSWSRPPRYVLITASGAASELAAFAERRLRASVHYDYCRKLGQLGALETIVLPDADERYLTACADRGQRLGDVKAPSLVTELGWVERLAPRLEERSA